MAGKTGRPPGSDPGRPSAKTEGSAIDWRIIRFLRRKPQPVRAVGVDDEGEEIVCSLTDSKSSKRWADAARVLHRCTKIHAVDKDGHYMRVLELDDDDPELAAERELDQARRGGVAGGGGNGSIISVDVPKLVDSIARNLREAVDASSGRQADAYASGFTAMTSVVNLCLTLLMRTEQKLALVETRLDEAAGDEANPRDQFALMALQGALGRGSPVAGHAPSNGHSNGAGLDLSSLKPEQIQAAMQWLASLSPQQGPENGSG